MLQPVVAGAEYRSASVHISAHIHPFIAVYNGICMDCIHIDVDVGGPTQVDPLGFIAQFYIAFGHNSIYDSITLFGGTGQCGMCCSVH